MSELETLPEGWVLGTIEDSGEYINGFAFKPQHRSETGLPIIRIQNLTDENKPIHLTDIEVDPAYKVVDGDILVSWSATLDTFIWRRGPALVNQHIFKVVPETKLIEKKLLFYWLKIAIEDLQKTEHLHGSTMKHINRGPFMAHSLPFPPKNEQTRIVEKLEELLSDLDNGVAELKAAQIKLTQYRQSLLKSAVEGSLTAEWRDAQGRANVAEGRTPGATKNQPTETGQQLLQRILDERRQRWEQQKLAEFREKGKNPPKDWKLKYPEPVQPDTSELPELPEGWFITGLESFISADGAGTKTGPFGTLLKKHEHQPQGVPVVGIENVKRMKFIPGSKIHITKHKASELKEYDLRGGDIVISRSGTVGEVCVIPENLGEARFSTNIMRLRVNTDVIRPNYFCLLFNADEYVLSQVKSLCVGSTRDFINTKILKSISFKIPTLFEQDEILKIASTEIDNNEKTYLALENELKVCEAQRKNILKDAFSGKLVPQDSDDEPASVLLEKIKAERAAQAKLPKPKRTKKKANNKASIMDTLFEVLKAKGDWMDAQEAFSACGVSDGTETDRIEELYAELRRLDKAEKILCERHGDYDMIKLKDE